MRGASPWRPRRFSPQEFTCLRLGPDPLQRQAETTVDDAADGTRYGVVNGAAPLRDVVPIIEQVIHLKLKRHCRLEPPAEKSVEVPGSVQIELVVWLRRWIERVLKLSAIGAAEYVK